MNLGWLCMSWRQPDKTAREAAANASNATRICAGCLIRHLRDFLRMEAIQKTFGFRQAEPGVLGFNAQEEPVPAGAHKVGRVEHRMIWLRQTIEREHAEHRSQRRAQDSAFERNRNERWP